MTRVQLSLSVSSISLHLHKEIFFEGDPPVPLRRASNIFGPDRSKTLERASMMAWIGDAAVK